MVRTFAQDHFTEAAQWVQATSHTPDLGGPITKHEDVPGSYYIVNNRLLCRGNGVVWYGGIPASADYTVQSKIVVFSNAGDVNVDGDAGVVGRLSTTTNNFYYLYINASGTQLVLARMDNGTPASLGTWSQTFVASGSGSSSYTIGLEMIGTAIKGYINSVERISVTDSVITDAGKAGIRSPAALSDTYTGKHYDDFLAFDTSTPAQTVSRFMGIIG